MGLIFGILFFALVCWAGFKVYQFSCNMTAEAFSRFIFLFRNFTSLIPPIAVFCASIWLILKCQNVI